MARRIQLRRDTAVNWSTTNPTLAQGEIGIDLTNKKIKIGTGLASWNSLAYWDDNETAAIGAFEFTGSTISTTDSTPIVINQATTVTSDLTVSGDILPSNNLGSNLGSPTNRFKEIFLSGNTIYLGDTPISAINGTVSLPGITTGGTVGVLGATANNFQLNSQYPNYVYYNFQGWQPEGAYPGYLDVKDSFSWNFTLFPGMLPEGFRPAVMRATVGQDLYVDDIIVLDPGTGYDLPEVVEWYAETSQHYMMAKYPIDFIAAGEDQNLSAIFNPIAWHINIGLTPIKLAPNLLPPTTIPVDVSDLTDNDGLLSGGVGLGTITVPAETGTDYKGLQVAYGGFHTSTDQSSTRNVTKVVIHKPAVTTTTIATTSESDLFQVAGVGTSDILALFVVIGDVNGEKPLSDIQAFAEAVIDNVILDGGVEGEYQTVDAMKAAFYDNYGILASASGGLAVNFEFFTDALALNDGPTTVQQGVDALFDIIDNGNGTYSAGILNGGTDYLPGHKIKILGTALGGATPDNDIIIRVEALTSGSISSISNTGVAAQPSTTTTYASPTDFPGYGNGPMGSGCVLTGPGSTTGRINIKLSDQAKIDAWLALAFGGQVSVSGTGVLDTNPGWNFGDPVTLDLTGVSGQDGLFYYQEFDTSGVVYQDQVSSINSVSFTEVTVGSPTTYEGLAGINHDVGAGFTVFSIDSATGEVYYNTYGTNYVVGDVITLLGANLTNGTTPENNITTTVVQVDSSGQPFEYTSSGTVPRVWRTNSINDGGNDEYDTGNYIDSSYDDRIPYNQGVTVADGAAAFGTGSSYSFAYEDSIFALFVTGNSSTSIGTSGSGPDSGSTIISGNIYGPNTAAQTFDNAVTHINLTSDSYAGPLITFNRLDDTNRVDEISEGLHIARSNNGGWLYNPLEDEGHDSSTPTGSVWNNDGWSDFTNVESRNYVSLAAIWQYRFNQIVGARMVMKDTTTDKYWAVEILSWGQNGGFSYTRQELDLDGLQAGIRFADGTRQTTAYVPLDTNVISTAPNNRRIETASGYKSVSVTAVTVSNTYTPVSVARPGGGQVQDLYIDRAANTVLEAAITLYGSYGGTDHKWRVTVDGQVYDNGNVQIYVSNEYIIIYNGDSSPITGAAGVSVTVERITGGGSVVWWDKDDLPGGSNNFRGAVIDYHAYTTSNTIVGTIHIIDDDGDNFITHTEVSSADSSDGGYDNLWIVESEGEIRYARVNGTSKTLKIHWTAKVFYGSDYSND